MNRPRTSSSSSSPPSSASSAATASPGRSEEHTSELQSSQISYAVFCLKKKKTRLNSSHSQIAYAVFCLKKNNHSRVSDLLAWYNLIHCAALTAIITQTLCSRHVMYTLSC